MVAVYARSEFYKSNIKLLSLYMEVCTQLYSQLVAMLAKSSIAARPRAGQTDMWTVPLV